MLTYTYNTMKCLAKLVRHLYLFEILSNNIYKLECISLEFYAADQYKTVYSCGRKMKMEVEGK